LHYQVQVLRLFYNAFLLKKSLELEPDDENANNNYASFLTCIRKDYDQAKKHYKKSLESKPNNASPAVDNQDNVPNDKTIIQPIDLDDCQQN
jgi:tetratricopeptide (TPR) repeat protein